MMKAARKQRLGWIALLLLGIAGAVALGSAAFRENLMFFHTPTDVATGSVKQGSSIRLGGLVEGGSVERDADSLRVRFTLADCDHRVPVLYEGILPDLFREGQGIVTMGMVAEDGTFQAQQVLAKHDENYMSPELIKALKTDTGHSCEPFRPVSAAAKS